MPKQVPRDLDVVPAFVGLRAHRRPVGEEKDWKSDLRDFVCRAKVLG